MLYGTWSLWVAGLGRRGDLRVEGFGLRLLWGFLNEGFHCARAICVASACLGQGFRIRVCSWGLYLEVILSSRRLVRLDAQTPKLLTP